VTTAVAPADTRARVHAARPCTTLLECGALAREFDARLIDDRFAASQEPALALEHDADAARGPLPGSTDVHAPAIDRDVVGERPVRVRDPARPEVDTA
jgi:hypothetical protein